MLVLAICCLSQVIISVDSTVLNIALPALQRDLHASVAGLQWATDSYTLVLASLLMLSGSTADRIGRRRVFQAGLIVFTLGSLLCSLAPNLSLLVAFRVVQAIGGSMLNPVALSIITNIFTAPLERARALGAWSGIVGLSMAAGPLVGGLLVDSVGWRSIFWINLPVGVAALLLTMRFVPESRAPKPRRTDAVGQLLVIALLGSLTYAIIAAPDEGWAAPRILALTFTAVIALTALVWYETRSAEPLVDMRFFRNAPFSGATVIGLTSCAALGGFLFLSALFLQNIRGLSALSAGLWTVPMAAMTSLSAPISGRLVGSRGPRFPLVLAGVMMTASTVFFAVLEAEPSNVALLIGYLLFGLGFGFVGAPTNNTAVSGMPRAQAGVAAGLLSTSRTVGMTLGVAVIGAVLASGVGAHTDRDAFVAASRPAWWIMAGCGLSVLVLGSLTTSRRALALAQRNAEHLCAPEPASDTSMHRTSKARRPPNPSATQGAGEWDAENAG